MKLLILVGISGSGKSTYAKNFVKDNPSYCIVSRDDFRYGLQNKEIQQQNLEDSYFLDNEDVDENKLSKKYPLREKSFTITCEP